MKRLTALFISVLMILALCCAYAQEESTLPVVREIRTEAGENAVVYPQLTGMDNAEIQTAINEDLVEAAQITRHLVTLSTLSGTAWTLKVDYSLQCLTEHVFSVVISAQGKMPNNREGQMNTALTYDLSTGERLTLEQLFASPEDALLHMEEIADTSLMEEMSTYMDNCEITPLPRESFTLSENGITFWYAPEAVKMLSGYSGACNFWYSELQEDWLDCELTREIGAVCDPLDSETEAAAVLSCIEAGKLPFVPAALGDSMTEAVAAGRLVRTPDEFPGGRYFVLEAPEYRDILLISDDMQNTWDHSVVQGIQLRRGGLYSLRIGETERQQWLDLLGEPEETILMTEDMSYSYNLPVGQYDLYRAGEHILRFYSDEEGLLFAIQICK